MSYVQARRILIQMLLPLALLLGLFACSPAPGPVLLPTTNPPTNPPAEELTPTSEVTATEVITATAAVIANSVEIPPQDISSGYDYPGDRAILQKWADQWEIDNITAHSWHLWAGMTAKSGKIWNETDLPVWETWCGNEEVFTKSCDEAPDHDFIIARQLSHTTGKPGPGNAQVVTFNKFNPAMADFLQKKQVTGGVGYDYTSPADLVKLNDSWPKGTPNSQRKIVDTPYQQTVGDTQGFAAIETKPVVFLVKAKGGLTPLPLWLGPSDGNSTNPTNATPGTWTTCILIDPSKNNPAEAGTNPVIATSEQIGEIVPKSTLGLACDPKKYLYAPLAVIWGFPMSTFEASAWNTVTGVSPDGLQSGLKAEAGDWAVLVGMHVNSKEILNWTWQTFWWQPGEPNPKNKFPGSKQGMTSDVKDSWRNYASCTAWNQTEGKDSTKIHVCFNPYLETSPGIPDGQSSNCMSCHGTATVQGPVAKGAVCANNGPVSHLSYPPNYKSPVVFGSSPEYDGYTTTDFSWAIPSDGICSP